MKSMSQANQDVWAYQTLGDNKTYIEIGASRPKRKNNTWNLEIDHGWRGYSIEFDTVHKLEWETSLRKNPCYWTDAMTFDHTKALEENKMNKHVNYVSCDIEPPENTFRALQNLIDQGVTFDLLTFEHDKFRNKKADGDYDIIAREYLKEKGYKVAMTDVYGKVEHKIFETWFVREDMQIEPKLYKDWVKTL